MRQKLCFQTAFIEETTSCARINDTTPLTDHTKATPRSLIITADNHHGARPHVLFLTNHLL
jgi:hypothetical protein